MFRSSVENNLFTIDYLSTIASIPKADELVEEMETTSISEKKRKSSDE